MLLRKGLEQASTDVIKHLMSMSEPITGKSERVAEVATISAGDSEIGKLIAEVMSSVGKDGVVTVEEGQGLSLESEVVEGFTFDRGFVSPYMMTDTGRMEAGLSKPAVVITDKKISNIQEISGLMEQLVQAGKKELVLIAEDVEGEAMTMLVLNKLKGVFTTVAVKAPSFGDRRKEILQDIAVLTGATVISEEQGHSFESVDLSFVGSARKVIVGKDSTTIVEGAGKQSAVKTRILEINEQIKSTTSKYDLSELEKRRAALSGKVAVIKVGGASETEIEEKKFRVDDAVAAVKAAMSEGVVAGGGVTLVNLSDAIKSLKNDTENSGLNPDEWLPQVKKAKTGHGVDVNNPSKIVDMLKSGVVDPAMVTKQAVQNAVSIAGTSMTMGALVVDVPEQKSNPEMSGQMGLGM
jgi:chaperonin GroEL